MADVQVRPIGTESCPADAVIPQSSEWIVKAVYASFDGTGAAGDFKPLVRVKSDAGLIVAESAQDTTVAAAGSADCSWFPRVAPAATSSVTVNDAEAAYVWRVYGGSVTVHSGSGGTAVPFSHFQTTDPTIFGTDTSNVATPPYNNAAGDTYLYFNKSGAYVVAAQVQWQTGAYAQEVGLDNTGNQYVLGAVAGVGFLTEKIATNTDAFGDAGGVQPWTSQMYYVDSSDTPGAIRVLVDQTSGSDKTVGYLQLGIFYLGGTTADLTQVY
jgi:hypothetical protein